MSAVHPDPFMSHFDSENNACIYNWLSFVELADYYIRSANALVTCAQNDDTLLDVHVQPICFLYRQALELALKDLTWKSHYAETGQKRFATKDWQELGRHRLHVLWKNCTQSSQRVLGSDYPLSISESAQVENLLNRFELHDPESYSFRYPISKPKGTSPPSRTHPGLINVNLRVLRASVCQAYESLKTVINRIDYVCEQNTNTTT